MKYPLPVFIGMIIGIAVTISSIFLIKIVPASVKQYQMSYADLSAILLTAVSILVTILGIVVAILAFWGYRTILKTAKQSAKDHIEAKLEVQGDLRIHIEDIASGLVKDLVPPIVRSETRPYLKSISSPHENIDDSERQRELGDETLEYGDE